MSFTPLNIGRRDDSVLDTPRVPDSHRHVTKLERASPGQIVQDREYRYRAFISYSHVDEAWAKWLHRALETYRVPKRLVGRQTEFGPVPARISPVFRDRDELATSTSLGDTLTRALRQSANQIVICSPAAAKSRWVNEEVLAFKRLGREHRVFCLIVGGEPGDPSQDCFPPALVYRLGANGQLAEERSEPIAADARPGKDGRVDVKLKLIAGILGVGLDDLKQREAHRRQVRMAVVAATAVSGMAITSTLAMSAWLARNEAERQRARAESEAETARQTTRFMVDLFKVSDPSETLGNTITAREILNRGAERINLELASQPDIQATLMDTMGTVYRSLGLLEPAERLARQAYEKRRTLFGPEHALVVDSLQNLGGVLTQKADYAGAGHYLDEALKVGRQLHGARSTEVAATFDRPDGAPGRVGAAAAHAPDEFPRRPPIQSIVAGGSLRPAARGRRLAPLGVRLAYGTIRSTLPSPPVGENETPWFDV